MLLYSSVLFLYIYLFPSYILAISITYNNVLERKKSKWYLLRRKGYKVLDGIFIFIFTQIQRHR